MFLIFIITYKFYLVQAAKKFSLRCNWISMDNFFFKHYFLFARYIHLLRKGKNISQRLLEKVSMIEAGHKKKEKHHYEHWDNDVMSKDYLEEMLCGWIAMAMLVKSDPVQYAKDSIEESEINLFSKKYLLNKLQVKDNVSSRQKKII